MLAGVCVGARVGLCVSVCVCVNAHTYAITHIHTPTHPKHTHTHTHTHTHKHEHKHVHKNAHKLVHKHMDTHTHARTHTNAHTHTTYFSKLEVACALAVIARSKPGYTVLQSRQKTVVKAFRLRHYVSFSVSLPVSVSVLAPLTPPPPLSLCRSYSPCRSPCL